MDFSKQNVLIIGGSSGIGAAVVRSFAKHSANIIFCSNEQEIGSEMENALQLQYSEDCVKFMYCDATKESEVEEIMSSVKLHFKDQLNVLINVVGMHQDDRRLDEFSASEFRLVFEINVMSYFLFCKYSLSMLRQSRGCIVNIASVVGTIGQKYGSTYSATKGAILAITKSMALDEAENNVRVNSVSPGIIDTPLLRKCVTENSNVPARLFNYEKELGEFEKLIPLHKVGLPENVADACLYLSSSMASYITGTDLFVTGGVEIGYGTKM